MFLQTLHLVLNVSDVLEAFLLRDLQFIFDPTLSLTAHNVQTVGVAVTVTEALVLCQLLEDRWRITESIRILVSKQSKEGEFI